MTHGLLLIDKSPGMTSHDVVARARRLTGIRQIGHAGTLDPMATGLLVVCVGHAVRLSEYLMGKDKTYTGRIKLGERTNTDDADGEIVERRDVRVAAADLARARSTFQGDILQVPPQFSAIQQAGQRAYQLARRGEAVDLPPRPVRIIELDLMALDDRQIDVRVTCSAGTYIRALARDIGEMLGCGAHLTSLRRIRSGSFGVEEAVTLDGLMQATGQANWPSILRPMDRAVEDMPSVNLAEDQARRFLMGQFVGLPDPPAPDRDGAVYRVYDAAGRFVALGRYDADQALLKPFKVFESLRG